VFDRETGRRIGNHLLRDSFVTHVYAGDVSDRLKHALAEHMGHRPQTAERVHNRMPGAERRRPALELASQLALSELWLYGIRCYGSGRRCSRRSWRELHGVDGDELLGPATATPLFFYFYFCIYVFAVVSSQS
jgi:hypothetical protein